MVFAGLGGREEGTSGVTGAVDEMLMAIYDVECSPSATSNLQNECETSLTSPALSISTIRLPVASIQRSSGSVSVLLPDPSESGDFDMISCKASDAATKISLSVEDRSRREMRTGIKGTMSLSRRD